MKEIPNTFHEYSFYYCFLAYSRKISNDEIHKMLDLLKISGYDTKKLSNLEKDNVVRIWKDVQDFSAYQMKTMLPSR